MVGRLRPNSSCGAWRPALGNPLESFQISRQVASIIAESIEAMAVGDNVIKQCVCMILQLAPHISKCCFMPYGRGVARTELLMLERVSAVHLRCTPNKISSPETTIHPTQHTPVANNTQTCLPKHPRHSTRQCRNTE